MSKLLLPSLQLFLGLLLAYQFISGGKVENQNSLDELMLNLFNGALIFILFLVVFPVTVYILGKNMRNVSVSPLQTAPPAPPTPIMFAVAVILLLGAANVVVYTTCQFGFDSQCMIDKAEYSLDPSICDSMLTSGDYTDTCYREATEYYRTVTDISFCEKLSSYERVDDCKASVVFREIEAANDPVAECDMALQGGRLPSNYSTSCFQSAATILKDVSVCSRILQNPGTWWDERTRCISDIAIATNNSDLCMSIENTEEVNDCIQEFAAENADSELCAKIDGTEERALCLDGAFRYQGSDISVCNELISSSTLGSHERAQRCIDDIVPRISSMEMCNVLVNPEYADDCRIQFANHSKDFKQCLLLDELMDNPHLTTSYYWRDACLHEVASYQSDPEICELMSDAGSHSKQMCVRWASHPEWKLR